MLRPPFAATAYGFAAMTAQLTLLRELLVFFTGNELIIGMVFSCWLVLTALGTRLINRTKPVRQCLLPYMMIWLGIIPFVLIFGLYHVVLEFFPPGIMLGILPSFFITLLVLAPFCLVSGAIFTGLNQVIDPDHKNVVSKVYAFDTLGAMMATLLYIFGFMQRLNPFQVFSLCMMICFISAAIIVDKPRFLLLFTGISMVAGIALWHLNPYEQLVAKQYTGQHIIRVSHSPYGRIDVTRSHGQTNIYLNGAVALNSGNTIRDEEQVHYAMLQRESIRNVLAIGGGVSAVATEVFKYQLNRLDYLDVNPEIIETELKHLTPAVHHNLMIHPSAPQDYIRHQKDSCDVILINLPPPFTLYLNAFYSEEFLHSLHKLLTDKGVISIAFGEGANYLSDNQAKEMGMLYRTLKSEFNHVLIIPGYLNYFLVSDRPLSLKIAALAGDRNLPAEYVNQYYLDDELLMKRNRYLMENLQIGSIENSSFRPQLFLLSIEQWMNRFDKSWYILAMIVIAMTGTSIFLTKKTDISLFLAAFISAAVEMVIVLLYQIWFGNLFQSLGFLMFFYMSGLFLGTYPVRSRFNVTPVKYNEINLLLFVVLIISLITAIQLSSQMLAGIDLTKGFLFAAMLLNGWLLGRVFRGTSKIGINDKVTRRASQLFSADLTGGALGSLAITLLMIPGFGFFNSLMMLLLILVISIPLLRFLKK